MGLQGQLTDCSTESIPILLVAIVANCLTYLRSILFTPFRSTAHSPIEPDNGIFGSVGSGLVGLIVLAEQLNLNRISSYKYGGRDCDGEPAASDCVVCLSKLREGESVRRLACRHVFHRECFDGWLDQLQFTCPLCRFPLVSERRVEITERGVSNDLIPFLLDR